MTLPEPSNTGICIIRVSLGKHKGIFHSYRRYLVQKNGPGSYTKVYIVHNVQIYKWKGEEENYQQIFAIFSIDIIST